MQMQSQRIKVFSDRYPLLGPLLWGLSIQFLIVQVIAARAWSLSFSLRYNTISDLANTTCGTFQARYVCSPDHALVNASLILLGLTMFFGAGLIYHEFYPRRGALIGFLALAIGGLGTAFVGVFPENSNLTLHSMSALLPFLLGNIGILILGLKLNLPPLFRCYTIISGTIALIALVLFILNLDFSLGIGTIERFVAYPQNIWLTFFGLYMSMNRYRARAAKRTQTT